MSLLNGVEEVLPDTCAMSHPEALRQNSWMLSELLGQGRLLGYGALLAWMVLFHLLVNVWLLCVFMSLLVVLGAWLGSQVILDSNCEVHLEHFFSPERVPASPGSELLLDGEIRSTVRKVIRDFVSSWYRQVSCGDEFEADMENAALSMALELKSRAKKVDRKALLQRVLNLCGRHLQSYMRAKEIAAEMGKNSGGDSRHGDGSFWRLYSKMSFPHPALQSSATEVSYSRAVVDLLLHVLVPPPHLETRTGRFVVGELITCNVLLPIISKMSDPDLLNLLIVSLFTESGKHVLNEEMPLTASPTSLLAPHPGEQEPEDPYWDVPSAPEASTPVLADVFDPVGLYCQQDLEVEVSPEGMSNLLSLDKTDRRPVDYFRPDTFHAFYQETDSDLESLFSSFNNGPTDSLALLSPERVLSNRLGKCASAMDTSSVADTKENLQDGICFRRVSCPKMLLSDLRDRADTLTGVPEVKAERLTSFKNVRIDLRDPAEKEGLGVEHAGRGDTNLLSGAAPQQSVSPAPGATPLAEFSFEPLGSPDGPVVIQNLRITGTVTAKEHKSSGSHPYTLYTVKYETAVDTETPGMFQPVAYHMVSRRYSEFLSLQSRLEEKPELRRMIKNVKGPKKLFPDLSFGNTDTDKVEARKGQLETFLKQLCTIPETANSEEVQEFLALSTDARIAFVKKPFMGSRIDKIVVNAITDTLKTAFPRSEPQSPVEDVEEEAEGRTQTDNKKARSRLRAFSKVAPTLNVADMLPKVLYCFDEGSTVFNCLSLTALEGFIEEQERLLGKMLAPEAEEEKGNNADPNRTSPGRGTPEKILQGAATETTLTDVALNLLCLLMKDQWSWLCTENIVKTIRLLFGSFIDRWLDVGVANLTSTARWVTYLQTLQETVWPGGALLAWPNPQRSAQQKEATRQEALHCLMGLLPDPIPDVLGSEKYRLSWQNVQDSLQDSDINRHLVHCFCDLLLEYLIPEASDEGFQKTLLNSLSGNVEKLTP